VDVHRPRAWLAPAEVELKRLIQPCRASGLKRCLEGRERVGDTGGLVGHVVLL
jgi:hypothetical protein